LELSDHVPAILCLTILNNQCKKYDIKIHGYYLAAGIDALMIIANICNNREYYNDKYGLNIVDNLITEVSNFFYKCVTQNIDTLRMSKNGIINNKLTHLCIEYAIKHIPLITKKCDYITDNKMKKTDLFCLKKYDDLCIQYKKKFRVEREILINDIIKRYGSVCKLAMGLGWILGNGDDTILNKIKDLSEEKTINKLEKISEYIGKFLKLHNDFKNIDNDIVIEKFSLNYVINYGIKEGYIELIESKANFIEGTMNLDVYTKTIKEIIDFIVTDIDNMLKDVSVDMETQYDDVSSI